MRRMAVRFWTLLFLVSLACIFKKKWNPVSGNHNPNVTHTIFSLSVIKEPAIKSIWCSTSFDRQLHIHFTSWRRYYYGIRLSLTSLLLLGGDIELNPGPAQKQERIENMYINQFRARKNVALWRCAKISIFLNRQLPLKHFHIFTVSESWQDRTVCDTDILIPGYTTFRQDRGPHKRGGGVLVYVKDIYKACVIEKWSSVSESNFQQLWLKVQCKKFKSFFLCIQFTCHRILPSIS